jgi:putative ATPase
MSKNLALFDTSLSTQYIPLAENLRPKTWDDFKGLDSLDQNLINQLREGKIKPPSMMLWGPPGSGKTTFAKLVGNTYTYPFVEFSAVLGGVKEVREIIDQAKHNTFPTILFMDEIHRFNKAQQDAFLPHMESGLIILIGATTENPSFYLTGALLSRSKVLRFPALENEAIQSLAERAGAKCGLAFSPTAKEMLFEYSGGDARRLLNFIESYSAGIKHGTSGNEVSEEDLKDFIQNSKVLYYDRKGEEHYNVVSAFIKSLRGSDADAALYWGFRMIEAGEDPLFVIRRMIIFASEDIGNADPRALQLAVSTLQGFEAIGLPEGKIPIAHCITYLATAPKSNKSYMAMHAAIDAVKNTPKVEVPLHLRNAPTALMKSIGYGKEYQYPHDHKGGHVKNVQYLPDQLKNKSFYEPGERGYEKIIKERIEKLKEN